MHDDNVSKPTSSTRDRPCHPRLLLPRVMGFGGWVERRCGGEGWRSRPPALDLAPKAWLDEILCDVGRGLGRVVSE